MQNLVASDIVEFKITEIKQDPDSGAFSRIILLKDQTGRYTSITVTSEDRTTLLLAS